MSFLTLLTLVWRQLISKWGRTLISALGIMVGVWAILLTVSLSQGLSEKLITAVNSQTLSRTVQFYKASDGSKSYFEFDFQNATLINTEYAVLDEQVSALKNQDVGVTSAAVSDSMEVYVHANEESENLECVNTEVQAALSLAEGNLDENERQEEILRNDCLEITTILQPFEIFRDLVAEADWYGSREAPTDNEIVLCFVCDPENPLHEAFGKNNPEELVGEEITLEYKTLPNTEPAGTPFDLTNPTAAFDNGSLRQSVPRAYRISAVYDDQEARGGLSGILNTTGYVAYSQYLEAIAQQEPSLDPTNLGYSEFNVLLESFTDLTAAIERIQNNGYLTFSTGQFLTEAIDTAFEVITIVLGIFALIALVAAVFGIVNVMLVSVLERQKEIGILKSLGSKNGDIFWIFLLESLALGIFGWLLGVVLTALSNLLVEVGLNFALEQSPEISRNLESLNITDFGIAIPVWALLVTLGLALLFTALSGLFPALNAAKQNPTEVLREE